MKGLVLGGRKLGERLQSGLFFQHARPVAVIELADNTVDEDLIGGNALEVTMAAQQQLLCQAFLERAVGTLHHTVLVRLPQVIPSGYHAVMLTQLAVSLGPQVLTVIACGT